MVLVTLSLRLQPRTALRRLGKSQRTLTAVPLPLELVPSASSAPSIAQNSATTLADLRAAEWPTYIHRLDSKEAKAAGGVLSRFTRLLEISRGVRVIPRHLKVGLPLTKQSVEMLSPSIA